MTSIYTQKVPGTDISVTFYPHMNGWPIYATRVINQDEAEDLQNWLRSCVNGGFDSETRTNVDDPEQIVVGVYLQEKKDAMLFKLAWM